MPAISQREVDRYRQRLAALKNERSSWEADWRDIADFAMPRRPQWLTSDRNRGTRKTQRIQNGVASRAIRKAASGIATSMTSPARPWFRLVTADLERMDSHGAREWLSEIQDRMNLTFQRSNIYQAFVEFDQDLVAFATCPLVLNPDPRDIMRASILPIGSYYVALDAAGEVDTIYHETQLTVGQVVARFCYPEGQVEPDLSRLSTSTRLAWKERRVDEPVDLCQTVEPNLDYVPGRAGAAGMRFKGVWFERVQEGEGEILSSEGFEEFPIMVGWWSKREGDAYGSGPLHECLSDVKQVNALEKRKMVLVNLLADPPLNIPATMRQVGASVLPGSQNWIPAGTNAKVEAAYEVKTEAITVLQQIIDRKVAEIEDSTFVSLFLMIADSDRRQITAEEIRAKRDEQILQLGPVIHRVTHGVLAKFIERAFGIMWRAGALPQPPEELQGHELRVEFISPMAISQRAVSLGSIDRTIAAAQGLAAIQPDVVDKIDADAVIDEVSEIAGVQPRLVRTDAAVRKIREARAAQAQMQMQMEAAKAAGPAARAARDLSQTDTSGGSNLLSELMTPA